MLVTTMPSYEAFDQSVQELLATLKYLKFSDLVLKIFEKLVEALGRVLEVIASKFDASISKESVNVILIIIVVIVVLMIALAIYFIVRSIKKGSTPSNILGEVIDKHTTIEQLTTKSIEFEKLGQYRDAVRLRFVAVLFYLHQNNYLYHDSSMTGEEMIRKLRWDSFVSIDIFKILTHMFNRIWYGSNELNEQQFSKWKEKEAVFWQEVGQ